ncbi:MAG: hypothetical protein ABI968_15445, partial [Acidobacteriota bacterium]
MRGFKSLSACGERFREGLTEQQKFLNVPADELWFSSIAGELNAESMAADKRLLACDRHDIEARFRAAVIEGRCLSGIG